MTAVIEPAATVEPTGDPAAPAPRPGKVSMWRLLWRDKLAVVAAVTLTFITLVAIFGPMLIGDPANDQDLSRGVSEPFTTDGGWLYFLGTDSLGRSLIARLIVAARTTFSVAVPAVLISLVIGSLSACGRATTAAGARPWRCASPT